MEIDKIKYAYKWVTENYTQSGQIKKNVHTDICFTNYGNCNVTVNQHLLLGSGTTTSGIDSISFPGDPGQIDETTYTAIFDLSTVPTGQNPNPFLVVDYKVYTISSKIN